MNEKFPLDSPLEQEFTQNREKNSPPKFEQPEKYPDTSQKIACVPRPAHTIFGDLGDPPTFIGNRCLSRKNHGGKYTVYTINTLHILIGELKSKNPSATLFKIRYLLTPNFELLFAEEGVPNKIIPPHFAMTGAKLREQAYSICAGNIKIDLGQNIHKINHKSGDFEPTFHSMLWALGALFANKIAFANTLIIEKLSSTGGVEERSSVELDDLNKMLAIKFSREQLQEFITANEKSMTREHTYLGLSVPRGRGFFPEARESRAKRPLFDEEALAPPREDNLREAILHNSSRKKALFSEEEKVPQPTDNDKDKPQKFDVFK